MHPLTRLLALNKGRGKFSIEASPLGAVINQDATIYLYDVIVSDSFWGGVTAKDFVTELNALSNPVIHLRIDSPGGDVFAARAMAQAIKEHPSQIIAHVDGHAASAATSLVVAADQSHISDGGMFMIHNAWTIAMGNANDFMDTAALLERVDQTIANEYIAKTGQSDTQIKDWMNAETYFFGQEAVDAGFVDSVSEPAVKNQIHWDFSAYKNGAEMALKVPVFEQKIDKNKQINTKNEENNQDLRLFLAKNRNRERLARQF